MNNKIKIFDLGSNTFKQTRNLVDRFNKFGEVVEVHTFEAQKELALDELTNLKKDYPQITFIHNNVAVWNENTNLNFYECKTWGGNFKGGASLIPHGGSQNSEVYEYDSPILTTAINFTEYFEKHSDKNMYIFIKMDIEGAEYVVLPDLLKSTSFTNLNELACEWHSNMYRNDNDMRKKFVSSEREIKNKLIQQKIRLSRWF
jgi:FkbM family methyltransferase